MQMPIILVVENDEAARMEIESELAKRYGSDYEIVVTASIASGFEFLESCKREGREAAVLLASANLPKRGCIEFLSKAAHIFPSASRGVLRGWGLMAQEDPLHSGMVMNQFDAIIPKPDPQYAEHFHKGITDLLLEWSNTAAPQFEMVKIIDNPLSPRATALRDLLDRNSVPYRFYESDSEAGAALLQEVQLPAGPFPVLILLNGKVLANPSNIELASALEVNPQPEDRVYDLVIVGAGPAGLSSAVYGASEGLDTLILEREAFGGQAGTSSMIRNYLGFSRGISGQDLAVSAYQQALSFGARFFFVHQATGLRTENGLRVVELEDGIKIRCWCVVLSMGVTYRRIDIPSLDKLIGVGVFYGAARSEAKACMDQHVFVAGAGNSAGQAAVHLAKYASKVTILARGTSLGASMSEYLIKEIEAQEKIEIRFNTEVAGARGEYRLEGLSLRNNETGEIEEVPAFALFILIGMKPHTEWLPAGIIRDQGGFIITGQDLYDQGELPADWPRQRPPMMLETSVPGVFAAGDVRYQSIKRVASAVGEGSIAIHHVHQYLTNESARSFL